MFVLKSFYTCCRKNPFMRIGLLFFNRSDLHKPVSWRLTNSGIEVGFVSLNRTVTFFLPFAFSPSQSDEKYLTFLGIGLLIEVFVVCAIIELCSACSGTISCSWSRYIAIGSDKSPSESSMSFSGLFLCLLDSWLNVESKPDSRSSKLEHIWLNHVLAESIFS